MTIETNNNQRYFSITDTRNSTLRKSTDKMTHQTALIMHKLFPWLTPDEVTILGVAEVLSGVCIAERNNLSSSPSMTDLALSLFLQLIGFGKDALDGALARIIISETPGKHDSSQGQINDVLADRIEEVGSAILRARTAYIKGSVTGETAALAVAATATLPSVAKAHVESLGYSVPELGMNLFEAAGTRIGRIVLANAATYLREIKGVPLQPSIDTFAALANLNSTRVRIGILQNPNIKPTLDQKEQLDAARRYKILMRTEAIALVATLAAPQIFRLMNSGTLDKSMSLYPPLESF